MIPLMLATTALCVDIQSGAADFSESVLTLSQNVKITLPENTTLTCAEALFNQMTKRLSLDGDVTYANLDFSVRCAQLFATMKTARLSFDSLEEAVIEGSVTLTHRKGDSMKAEGARYRPEGKTLSLEKPAGLLATRPYPTQFGAGSLTWSLERHEAVFKDAVHVEQKQFGTFEASDSVVIQHDAQRQLRVLVATGDLKLMLSKERTLTCTGTLVIDHTKQTLELVGTPITFLDPHGEIQADRALFTYALDEQQRPDITEVVLIGNVKIADFATVDHVQSSTCLHYILTDHATLDPTTQTVTLKSDPGGRTLLFDEINNIQASAPGLVVKRNASTKKETIQGMGDVRFQFSEQELTRLQQQFKMIQHANKTTP